MCGAGNGARGHLRSLSNRRASIDRATDLMLRCFFVRCRLSSENRILVSIVRAQIVQKPLNAYGSDFRPHFRQPKSSK